MNKQELIKKYEHMNHDYFRRVDVSEVLSDLIRLDKPQKPVIPQFVADWIERRRKIGEYSLLDAMHLTAQSEDFRKWIMSSKHQNIFARAWLDGYEIEKEPKYKVKVKGNLGQYLGKYYLNNVELTPQFIRTQKSEPSIFTKEELEQTGFGWVFDCPGMEVEEVEG